MVNIKSIEKILCVKLPEKYIDYILNNKMLENILINVSEETILIKKFLTLDINSNDYILKIYEENKDLMLDGIIPIADAGFGDYICFYYKSRDLEPQIVYWIYDLSLESLEEGVSGLFNTFDEFLIAIQLIK